MKRGSIFVVSGPSGVGKGTVVKRLKEIAEGIGVSVSATTRGYMREGERDGVDYFFKTNEEFDRLIKEDAFVEYAVINNGDRYGTLRSEAERILSSGQDLLLEIDVQGYFSVKEKYPEAIGVFISPPSMENLKKRLLGRNTETAEEVAVRMAKAEKEMAVKDKFEHVIIHQDWSVVPDALDIAANELYDIIKETRANKREE